MRGVGILTVFVPFLLALPNAHSTSMEAKARAAKKACLTGDPAKGVALLADLYIDTDDPTYIFNQGRCFEYNRRYEDAIGRFREYLIKAKNASKEARSGAEEHIAACQSYLGLGTKSAETSPTPAAKASEAPPVVEPPPKEGPRLSIATPPAVVTVQQDSQVITARKGAWLRSAGVASATVGGAALIAGVVLNLKVNSMSRDLEDNYSPGTDSKRKDYWTLGWISYGVGAGCVAAGAALYYLGWSQGRTSSGSLALVPTIVPGTVGAAFTGAF